MSIKTDITEKMLLYKIQTKKDAAAFGVLYDMYIEKIYRFVSFKVTHRQDAEDITSTVFLKTWGYLTQDGHKPIKSFSGLIYSIARNTIVDFYRAKATERAQISLEELVEERTSVDLSGLEQVANKIAHETLLDTLKHMKQEYQEVILLKYIEEYSAGEIAEILGKSQTNVRVTLHRAVSVLKRLANK